MVLRVVKKILRLDSSGRRLKKILALGWENYNLGLLDAAEAEFRKAALVDPSSASGAEGLGWVNLARGEYLEAEADLGRALALDPGADAASRGMAAVAEWRYSRFNAAWALFYQARYVEALEAFYQVLADPTPRLPARETPRLLSGIGWCHYYLRQFSESATRFRQIVDFRPDDLDAVKGLGYSQFFMRDYDAAISTLSRVLELAQSSWEPLSFTGWCCYEKHDYEKAASHFQKAIDSNPYAADPRFGLGWATYRMGKVDESRRFLTEAIDVCPDHPSLSFLLETIERHPDWCGMYAVLGWAYNRFRNYDGAEFVFHRALQMHPGTPEFLMGLGFARFRLGKYSESKRALEEAIEGDSRLFPIDEIVRVPGTSIEFPMKTDCRSILAWCNYYLGEYAVAEGIFRQSLSEHPDWVYLDTGIGWCCLAQGKFPEAEEAFNRTLAVNPHYFDALNGLEKVRQWRYSKSDAAWNMFYAGDYVKAGQLFKEILAEKPQRVRDSDLWRVRAGLGEVALAERRFEEAVSVFEEILRKQPENQTVRERVEVARRELLPNDQ